MWAATRQRQLRETLDTAYIVQNYEPAYLESYRRGEFPGRVDTALAELEECEVCPRNCRINRLEDETRVCHTGRHATVSSAFAHFGEEDCLRGWRGSGTIFFAMCNLKCVFCQNWDISQKERGEECTGQDIAALMLALQTHGCHNVNFVTPEHVVPQVVEAIAAAIPMGLNVPIVYNTSAYDSLESLQSMEGLIDIYMPDFKFWSADTAKRLAKAKDYPERAREAIKEMHRQVGPLRFGRDGLARRGLLIRHLVMPGQTEETRAILEWIATELGADTYVNIMGQYRPEYRTGDIARDGTPKYGDIDRRPTQGEMEAAFGAARELGLRLDMRVGA
jgi:putative pyruvate formate lyase activating enzyme